MWAPGYDGDGNKLSDSKKPKDSIEVAIKDAQDADEVWMLQLASKVDSTVDEQIHIIGGQEIVSPKKHMKHRKHHHKKHASLAKAKQDKVVKE